MSTTRLCHSAAFSPARSPPVPRSWLPHWVEKRSFNQTGGAHGHARSSLAGSFPPSSPSAGARQYVLPYISPALRRSLRAWRANALVLPFLLSSVRAQGCAVHIFNLKISLVTPGIQLNVAIAAEDFAQTSRWKHQFESSGGFIERLASNLNFNLPDIFFFPYEKIVLNSKSSCSCQVYSKAGPPHAITQDSP